MFFSNFSKHLRLLHRVMPHIWHVERPLKRRLILALSFIILTMALNISVPLIFKQVVGSLAEPHNFTSSFILYLLIAYGLLWTLAQVTLQMREIVLFRVVERAIRNLSLLIFRRLHALSLRFHLDRRTGALTNAIERH